MPFLEVLSAPYGQPVAGSRFGSTRAVGPLAIGRAPDAHFRLDAPGLAAQHLVLAGEGRSWTCHAQERFPSSWVDGAQLVRGAPVTLSEGACLELGAHAIVLGFSHREGPYWPRDEALEEALADDPTDLTRWAVYADFLQAHGDPWGLELAAGTVGPTPGRLRAVGPLARAWRNDDISCTWNGVGAAATLTLRPHASQHLSSVVDRTARTLASLGAAKALAFITDVNLGLEMGSLDEEHQVLERARRLLEALASSPPLRALRRVSLGLGTFPRELPSLEPLLVHLRRRHPRLEVKAHALVQVVTSLKLRVAALPPWLTLGRLGLGDVREVTRQESLSIGADGRNRLQLRARRGEALPHGELKLAWVGGAWRLYRGGQTLPVGLPGLKLNGHTNAQPQVLLPGDEIEFDPGVKLVVEG